MIIIGRAAILLIAVTTPAVIVGWVIAARLVGGVIVVKSVQRPVLIYRATVVFVGIVRQVGVEMECVIPSVMTVEVLAFGVNLAIVMKNVLMEHFVLRELVVLRTAAIVVQALVIIIQNVAVENQQSHARVMSAYMVGNG